MSASTVEAERSASCPTTRPIEPTERLYIPHRKRLSHSYVVDDRGARQLRIDYGIKDITFEEARMFAFGEQLVRQPSFTGELATTWGPGYAWDELRPMLEALVEEGILRRGDGVDDPRGGGVVASRVPPSVCPEHRSWSLAECEAITRELAGRAIEVGYLEAVLPIYRIAHAALDADGRQVGEGNVYPPRLRLDRDTEWRVCQYSGSRYRDDAPMNVTALRAMIKHWKPMMATIVGVAAELRARLGGALPWSVGELHSLACVVLGLPAYQLLKRGGASPQVALHPVLSSLFRITDGIRMTTYVMMFSIEHTHRVDQPITAAELHAHVEHNGVFIGDTGVCAGPGPLVDEFLANVVDGVPPEGIDGPDRIELPAEVQAVMAELPAAIDYGLYALQTWAVSVAVWLAMSRAYEVVRDVFAPGPAGEDRHARLRARLAADWGYLERLQLTRPYDRAVHANIYVDTYERSWRALRAPVGPASFAQAIAPVAEGPLHVAAAEQLRARLAARLSSEDLAGGAPALDRVVDALVRYCRDEQAILATTLELQDAINAVLERPRPTRRLEVRDLHASWSLGVAVPSAGNPFPYLFDLLEDELGVRVVCTAGAIEVSDRRAR